jgi:hypothetical protein
MSQRDPLEALEDALFAAARRERTQSGALERTLGVVVRSHRQRRRRRTLLTLGATLALAAGVALIVQASSSSESIQAERIAPKHAVTSVAAPPPPPQLAEASEEPAQAVADGGATLRSGLAPSVVTTTLEEETAMLAKARAELTSGKTDAALASLDRYDRVSGGHLTAEATLLRIQALAASGRSSLAAKLAQRLVDSDPNGAIAERARHYVPQPRGASQQKP